MMSGSTVFLMSENSSMLSVVASVEMVPRHSAEQNLEEQQSV